MTKEEIQQVLFGLITLTGLASAIWSASMLVGGFDVTGQLSSESNPLGTVVLYVAALSIVTATALWYYCLSHAERRNLMLAVATGGIVLSLTAFASITQLFSVVDAANGEAYENSAQATTDVVWESLKQVDQSITQDFVGYESISESGLSTEAETGRGPLYRAAQAEWQRVRRTYGALRQTLDRVSQGSSISDSLNGARDYLAALRGKVRVFEQFARDIQLSSPDYMAQLDAIEARLNSVSGGQEGEWVDRRSLVYKEVASKLKEMVLSWGQADLAFSLSFLLAVMPDIIQLLCALLLVMLRPDED